MNRKNKVVLRNTIKGYLFLLPNFLGFAFFTAIPVVAVFVLSFTDWNAFKAPNFVGLNNFLTLFTDANFKQSLVNNFTYTLIFVPGTLMLALLFALGLNQKIRFKEGFRVIYFLPHITSMVAAAMVWRMIFNDTYGPLSNFLRTVGIDPPGWLSNSKWALISITVMSIWKNYGYYIVILLAGLAGIPYQLYEAAELDGANRFQKFRYITWPMLSPTMFFALITCIISSFKVFDAINIMTEGGPGRSTYVLVYTIYTEAFQNYKFGYASSVALVLFLIILIVTLIQWRGQKKWVEY
ncbi:sugar ABC transporter permease [Clostridium sp. AN503]|uniref:carbohydrate ABC transporter permease n=1 Tax=Clostridium sp. AN503 TaxID=3160598 RepID=UPI0034579042